MQFEKVHRTTFRTSFTKFTFNFSATEYARMMAMLESGATNASRSSSDCVSSRSSTLMMSFAPSSLMGHSSPRNRNRCITRKVEQFEHFESLSRWNVVNDRTVLDRSNSSHVMFFSHQTSPPPISAGTSMFKQSTQESHSGDNTVEGLLKVTSMSG